jgi:hypothetical protein
MKCVRYLNNGDVFRLSDEDAEFAVQRKQAIYIPKKEWKTATRPAQLNQENSNGSDPQN